MSPPFAWSSRRDPNSFTRAWLPATARVAATLARVWWNSAIDALRDAQGVWRMRALLDVNVLIALLRVSLAAVPGARGEHWVVL